MAHFPHEEMIWVASSKGERANRGIFLPIKRVGIAISPLVLALGFIKTGAMVGWVQVAEINRGKGVTSGILRPRVLPRVSGPR